MPIQSSVHITDDGMSLARMRRATRATLSWPRTASFMGA